MSCHIAKRALKKIKSRCRNRDERKGTPEKVVGNGLGYLSIFEQRPESCDKGQVM